MGSGPSARAAAVAGFALLWSLGKACLNQHAFAYPLPGTTVSLAMVLFLAVPVLVVALRLFSRGGRGLSEGGLVAPAVCASVGGILLVTPAGAGGTCVGAVLYALGITLLQLAFMSGMRLDPDGGARQIALSFLAGNVLSWLFSIPALVGYVGYLFCAFPLLAVLLKPGREGVEPPGAPDPVGLRDWVGAVQLMAVPIVGYCAFNVVSIAFSFIFMAQGALDPAALDVLHITAGFLGAAAFAALAFVRRHRAPLVLVVYLCLAALLLPAPFLSEGYREAVKLVTMAASEMLFAAGIAHCAEASADHGIDPGVLAGTMLAGISASTLLGLGIGMLCSSLGEGATAAYIFVELVSFSLLLVTAVLLLEAQRDGRLPDPIVVASGEHLSPERAAALAAGEYGLTAREAEVLSHLLNRESVQQIADALVLSKDTVRGHIKSLYRKTGVHSRQELELKAGDGPTA